MMKVIILSSLSVLFLSVPIAAIAQTEVEPVAQNESGHCSSASKSIDPFRLVYRAYEGSFRAQGIPGGGALLDRIALKRITAEDLVQSAIEQGRLSSDALDDRAYINAVEFQMRGLLDGGS